MNFLSEQENEKKATESETEQSSRTDEVIYEVPKMSEGLDTPEKTDEHTFSEAEGHHALEEESEGYADNGENTETLAEAAEQQDDAQQDDAQQDDAQQEQTAPQKEKNGLIGFVYDTVELVAVSLVLVMIILTVFARHSPVNGSSMYPTILGRNEGSSSGTVGKDVLLISDLFYTPKKGDIVVVQTPNIKSTIGESLDHPIVKRIIATEHDRVEIDFTNWRIVINGEVYEDGLGSASYVNYDNAALVNGTPSKPMEAFYPSVLAAMRNDSRYNFTKEGTVYAFTVPEGQVFILGDNRNHSTDSRAIGLIDERWIIGKSLLRVYPFDRISVVD